MVQVFYSDEVRKFIERLNPGDRARVQRIRRLFEVYGFQVGRKYIKKISARNLWELRAGDIRIFLCLTGNKAFGVHAIHKKSKKLARRDIELAEKRCKQV